MRHFILFEDDSAPDLYPFSLNHASFEIRCGVFTNIERVRSILKPSDRMTLVVRNEIVDIIKERFAGFEVNPPKIGGGLWLNGACTWEASQVESLQAGHSYTHKDKLVAFTASEDILFDDYPSILADARLVSTRFEGTYFRRIWDAIFQNGRKIFRDAADLFPRKPANVHPSAVLLNSEAQFYGDGCIISAGVILDAASGPIIIGEKACIGIGALIQGPVSIGPEASINPGAKLRGNVSLGPLCKVGGEVEDSIFQGYSNKQHDGFLGHSYIGEWVNLGANTCTSDLKNNYSPITVNFRTEAIETGMQFLGSMIGDYTKTGISTMLNTGTIIGLGANIFGGDFQPKTIPSFAWGQSAVTELSKFIKTCEIMKARRGLKLTIAEREFLAYLHGVENEG